jgi:Ca-activated chloride channel homolog
MRQRPPNAKRGLISLAALLGIFSSMPHQPVRAQSQPAPIFRSSIALVPITALVRDARNRIVPDLVRDDFQVLEQGRQRPIVDFRARSDAPISVAFLFDTSGSMHVAANFAKGRAFVEQFVRRLEKRSDEAALFTFHKVLRQEVPFTSDGDRLHRALKDMHPWGLTSLYDAVAETARRLADRPTARRAVVVISDGVDTSSTLDSAQVAALASSIDVPVYVVAVTSPLDDPTHALSLRPDTESSGLDDLARRTGGELFYVSGAEHTGSGTSALLATMRQQYFLAIESAATAGWYSLEVRTRREGLKVHARSGYFARTTGESR